MPFRHPDRSHDLGTRIEMEVRERLEEAVDYVCLEALVRARRTAGLPAPAADNPADRRAYIDNVLTLLRRLGAEITPGLPLEQERLLTAESAAGDEQARLLATQARLARLLPDYWQRFEAVSLRYLDAPQTAEAGSGSQGRGLLGRLFGRR